MLFETLHIYLHDSDEVRQLQKIVLTLFLRKSQHRKYIRRNIIFLENKLITIFIVGFTEDYRDRPIAKVPFDYPYDFKLVIKHIKREMHLGLEKLKFQLIFESGDSN